MSQGFQSMPPNSLAIRMPENAGERSPTGWGTFAPSSPTNDIRSWRRDDTR